MEQEAWKEATTFDAPAPDPGAVFDLIRTANNLPLTNAELDRQAAMHLAQETKKTQAMPGFSFVAGAGFEPATFGL
ncbi:MAG: hypothetical protein V3S32_00285 [Acidimicrobiia bacterium]